MVRNLNLADVNVQTSGISTSLGALAGENRGTISNVHVLSGTVGDVSEPGLSAGGLVGLNCGLIQQSGSAAALSGGPAQLGRRPRRAKPHGRNDQEFIRDGRRHRRQLCVGGRPRRLEWGGDRKFLRDWKRDGWQPGFSRRARRRKSRLITTSHASGIVAVGGGWGGGLAGLNLGSIAISYATGLVTVGDGGVAGGLVGGNFANAAITVRTLRATSSPATPPSWAV